jgi:malic enzyme
MKSLDLVPQGTAATAVAGVYGALAVQGKSFKELAKQRIVVLGAGSAGMGVSRMLALGMVKQVSCPLTRQACSTRAALNAARSLGASPIFEVMSLK